MVPGMNLEQRRANAVRRAYEEKVQEIAYFGDAPSGMKGFFNNNQVDKLVPDKWFDTSAVTPDELIALLNEPATRLVQNSNMKEMPNTMLVPYNVYRIISTTPRSSTTARSTAATKSRAQPRGECYPCGVDPSLPLACGAALLAGFVDAVAGGGGLIQLPALLVLYPEAQPEDLFGTNKAASFAGTSTALARYARAVTLPWRHVGGSALAAFGASFCGARLAAAMPVAWMRPLVVVLLAGVLAWTLAGPTRGLTERTTERPPRPGAALLVGALLGLYDGFFGPGTGSFLLFAFVTLLGMDFLTASAGAKVVNVATNLAALAAFVPAGHVRWELALPMAACSLPALVVIMP
jgi:uncharacterized membrane protein YfcA